MKKRNIWDRCQCCSVSKCGNIGINRMSTKIWKKKKRSLLEECGSETGKERGEARRLLSKWHLNSWKDGIVWFLQHETIGTCVLKDFDSVVEIYLKLLLLCCEMPSIGEAFRCHMHVLWLFSDVEPKALNLQAAKFVYRNPWVLFLWMCFSNSVWIYDKHKGKQMQCNVKMLESLM